MNIAIKVDPGNSVSTINKVENELAKLENRADSVKTTSFKQVNDQLRAMETQTAGARRATDNLAQGFRAVSTAIQLERLRGAGAAFAGLTAQLQREGDVLESIRGPEREHMLNMQALQKLYERGAISAAEYTEQLQKAGAVHGPQQQQGPSGGGAVFNEIGGQIMGMVGPAALAAGAVATVGKELERFKERRRDVEDATNTILKFHDSMDSVNVAMIEQRRLAEDLHLNITKTTHAYADVREATDSLGLSSKQMADITRNLGAALMVDGGSIEGVSAIMEKLRYSTEAGIMSQRELKAIWQQSPEVANSFAKSLGKTYPELMKMAKEGKLTKPVIEQMTIGLKDGHEAIDKYNQRLMDVDRVMAENHVGFLEATIIIEKAKDGYKELGETVAQQFERIQKSGAHAFETTQELVDKLRLITSMGAVSADFFVADKIIQNGFKAQGIIDGLKTPWEHYRDTLKDTEKALLKTGMSHDEVAKQLSRVHPPEWVDYYKQELDAIQKPEQDWMGRLNALESLYNNGRVSLDQYNAALRELVKTYAGTDLIGMIDAANGVNRGPRDTEAKAFARYQLSGELADRSEGFGTDVDKTLRASPSDLAADLQASGPSIGGTNELTKKWRHELSGAHDDLAALNEVGKTAFGSIENALTQLATTGKFSFSGMVDSMISDLGRLASQRLMASLFSALGSLGSTTELAPGVMSAAEAHKQLYGFATGGSFIVGGSGGTDSQAVAFRATPGEMVSVHTPPQQQAMMAAAAQAPAAAPVVINNHIDVEKRALAAVSSGSGDKHLVEWARRNAPALRSLLSK